MNVKILMFCLAMKTPHCLPCDVYLASMNMKWLTTRLKSCKAAHESTQDFTLVEL